MPTIAKNKKAYHDYEILKTFEAGVILSGPEVKSARSGQINLASGYITIDQQETPWLINIRIAPYPPAFTAQQNYDPLQNRKILLHKKEIISLIGKIRTQGLTLIPLRVYTKKGLIKIEVGLVKGKKKWDKRENIEKREKKIKIQRRLKR